MSAVWMDVLREACALTSQTAVAQRLHYSQATISAVLDGTYKSGTARVQAAVEAVLMNAQVMCPVLGPISRARCLGIQRQPFTPTNPTQVALYRACRSGCEHSLLPQTIFPLDASAAQPAVANNTGSRGTVPTPHAGCSHGVTPPTGRRKRLPHARKVRP